MTGAAAEVAGRETAASVKGQCDKRTALNLTREIKRSVEQSWRLIKEAFERRAWAALDYESWESYCHNELGTGLVRLSKELRREAVAGLMTGDQPMSNRAIAAAIGVDEGTVRNDLRALAESSAASPVVEAEVPTDSGEEQSEDERPQDEQPLNEEHEHEPVEEEQPEEGGPAPIRRVTGVDGKSYTTKPESKSRRRPLPDAFLETAHKVDKAAQRLVRLTEDDRFPAHAANLGGRDDLQRAADALRTALDALTQAGNVG